MNYFAAFLGLLSVFNASVFGPFTVPRSWSKGVLSTLREGNEGLDEMERFANRVKVGWGDVPAEKMLDMLEMLALKWRFYIWVYNLGWQL